jgi:hypothetical protein
MASSDTPALTSDCSATTAALTSRRNRTRAPSAAMLIISPFASRRMISRGIGIHSGGGRFALLSGYRDADPGWVEPQAVIHAANAIAFLAARCKRGRTVTAAVLHHYQTAVLPSLDDHRFAEEGPFKNRVVGHFEIPGHYVACVSYVQCSLPNPVATSTGFCLGEISLGILDQELAR